jgi:hypothetical protein
MKFDEDFRFFAAVLIIAGVFTVGIIRWMESDKPIPAWALAAMWVFGFLYVLLRMIEWTSFKSLFALLIGAYVGYRVAILLVWSPPIWLLVIGSLAIGIPAAVYKEMQNVEARETISYLVSVKWIEPLVKGSTRNTVWGGFWFLYSCMVGYLISLNAHDVLSILPLGILVGLLTVGSSLWFIRKCIKNRNSS